MKKHTFRLTILIISLFFALNQLPAQSVPQPYAHYPLDAWKIQTLPYPSNFFLKVNPYDVSGNHAHGTFYENGNVMDVYAANQNIYQEADFPGVITCIEKTLNSDSYLEIPDPLAGYDLQNGFALTFWVYFNPQQGANVVLTIPKIQVKKTDNTLYVAYKNQATNAVFEFPIEDNRWVFVSLVFDGATKSFTAHTYDYIGGSYVDSETVLNTYTGTENQLSLQDYFTEHQLMSYIFNGRLRDVKFFHQTLSKSQANFQRGLDWGWAHELAQGDHYVRTGTFAHYTLDGSTSFTQEIIHGRNGTSYGSVSEACDRYGNLQGAAYFVSETARVETPDFFDSYNPFTGGGFTISFWINIESPLNGPIGGVQPFTDDDIRNKIFFADDAVNEKTLLGMQYVNDRLGIIRYYQQDVQSERKPWFLWWQDPVSFNQQVGWYHVILTYDKYRVINYIYKPGDADLLGPGGPCNTFGVNLCEQASFAYMGVQDLPGSLVWGIGNRITKEEERPATIVDDFMIFKWPMSKYEVQRLHELQDPDNGGSGGSVNISASKENNMGETGNEPVIFPNPNSGTFTLNVLLSEDSEVKLSVRDITGKSTAVQSKLYSKGTQSIPLNYSQLRSGLYFLDIEISNAGRFTKKFLVSQ